MKNQCRHNGCKKKLYGKAGGNPQLCSEHAEDGMVDVRNKRCGHSGWTKHRSFDEAGGKAELCAEHKADGMVCVRKKLCVESGCTKLPSYGERSVGRRSSALNMQRTEWWTSVARGVATAGAANSRRMARLVGEQRFCSEHAEDGMVDVRGKKCAQRGCTKYPSCGWAGGRVELGAEHAKDGMTAVWRKKCGHSGCKKSPTFSTAERRKRELCVKHAEDGMINVKRWSSGKETVGHGS